MNNADLAVFIVGLLVIIVGVLVIGFRRPLLDFVRSGQSGAFTRARTSHLAAAGVFALLLGSIFIVVAFVPGAGSG